MNPSIREGSLADVTSSYSGALVSVSESLQTVDLPNIFSPHATNGFAPESSSYSIVD